MKRIWTWLKYVIGSFLEHNCSMHAAGLTYFALLAIIPILCCMLVLAKACGVDRYARGAINARIDAAISNIEKGQDDQLAKLAPQSEEARAAKRQAAEQFALEARKVSNELFGRIEAFDVGTLGWIGFGFLLWTVISSLGMVETSFNEIRGIPKPRPIWKRAYTYLFIMIVLPVLAAVAMSLPILNAAKSVVTMTLGATVLTKWLGDGIVWFLDWKLFRQALTILFSTVFFGFFFWVMPNGRVRPSAAGWGGLFTALLFAGWIKVCAVAQVGIAKSSALYGSFAFLPIVLAWLYMSWQIILLGAVVVRSFDAPPSAAGSPAPEATAS